MLCAGRSGSLPHLARYIAPWRGRALHHRRGRRRHAVSL